MYDYRCTECHTAFQTTDRASCIERYCNTCADWTEWQRVWGLAFHRGYGEHWNHAVAKPISNDAQFRSELSKASDEYSERSGIEARFVPIDLRDPAHRPPESS